MPTNSAMRFVSQPEAADQISSALAAHFAVLLQTQRPGQMLNPLRSFKLIDLTASYAARLSRRSSIAFFN